MDLLERKGNQCSRTTKLSRVEKQKNVVVYLESRCRKFWRRTHWIRAPSSHTVYYEGLEVADANLIDMKKICVPPADVAGCVYLKDVLPKNMIAQYTNPEDGSTPS